MLVLLGIAVAAALFIIWAVCDHVSACHDATAQALRETLDRLEKMQQAQAREPAMAHEVKAISGELRELKKLVRLGLPPGAERDPYQWYGDEGR